MNILAHWRLFAAVAVIPGCLGVYHLGKSQGYSDAITDQLRQDIKAERERGRDDEKLRGLSDYDLCVIALHRRGLPVDHCDELRGVQTE